MSTTTNTTTVEPNSAPFDLGKLAVDDLTDHLARSKHLDEYSIQNPIRGAIKNVSYAMSSSLGLATDLVFMARQTLRTSMVENALEQSRISDRGGF